jgi:hypothetical protein
MIGEIMTEPKAASSVVIGNKIQTALAREICNYGRVTLALVLIVDKDTEDVIEGRIVTEDELAGFVRMYKNEIK